MKVIVKESALVKPVEETPSGGLWLSNLDLVMPIAYYSRFIIFFRHNGAADFFDAAVLKEALSKALVDFYPFAGRLRKGDEGRVEINCNAEGVVFLEAECDGALDELDGFTPRADVTLLPQIDSSQHFSTLPLLLMQLTRFRCGGVSLGFTTHHHVVDGFAVSHYITTWSEIARGLTPTARPFLDRRLLSASNPPQPQYPHIEYQIPPSLQASLDMSETSFKMFRLSRDQIDTLQNKCNHHHQHDGGERKDSYTKYETVAGHAWRTVCMARRLPHDQVSKFRLPVDGRGRLRPPLPPHFFGNGIFYTTAVASCGEIVSNPLRFTVAKIHEAVARMNGDYMRSAVDYLEMELPKAQCVVRNLRCPNFGMTNWIRMPLYRLDFGWGEPVFVGPGQATLEGKSFVFDDLENEGGVQFVITLLKPHMELFEKLIHLAI